MGRTPETPASPIYLNAADLARLLTPRVCRDALAGIYAALAGDPDCAAQSLSFPLKEGGIHVKASLAPGARDCFAAKINVNLPANPVRRGLPTIQGLVVLVDAKTGLPLAVLDSPELTARRTAAATALAATFGARAEAQCAALIGCGKQSRYQAEALIDALPGLREFRLFDLDAAKSAALAAILSGTGNARAVAAASLDEALHGADVCVAGTTATEPYLVPDRLPAGIFVAGVGADSPSKCEIAPACFAAARIMVDDIDQCAAYGDLAHAIRAGTATRDTVHASLADLASGRKRGRANDVECVIFDSTGSGVQDLAAAQAAYGQALKEGIGISLPVS